MTEADPIPKAAPRALLVLLALALAMPTAMAASQHFYPDDTGTTDVLGTLKKTTPDNQHTHGTLIQGTEGVTWIAEDAATTDVHFGTGTWSFSLRVESKDAITTTLATVAVGSHDPVANQTAWLATAKDVLIIGGTTVTGNIPVAQPLTIPAGEHLAYRVAEQDKSGDFTIRTNHDQTWLASPDSDPGYPAWELPSIALLIVGAAGLAARRMQPREAPEDPGDRIQ